MFGLYLMCIFFHFSRRFQYFWSRKIIKKSTKRGLIVRGQYENWYQGGVNEGLKLSSCKSIAEKNYLNVQSFQISFKYLSKKMPFSFAILMFYRNKGPFTNDANLFFSQLQHCSCVERRDDDFASCCRRRELQ